jgi:hypothetical protein
VDVCLDLFPADEDISRFDFIVLVPEPDEYISPLNDDGTLPEQHQLPDELRQLIRWVWSRNRDQVKFDTYVEKYIEHVAMDLNKDFGSSVKIIGIEGVKKIARIATSIAACCFSVLILLVSALLLRRNMWIGFVIFLYVVMITIFFSLSSL